MASSEVREERIEPLWDRVDRNNVELVLWEILFLASCAAGACALIGIFLLLALVYSMQEPRLFEWLRPNIGRLFLTGSAIAIILGAGWMMFALTRSEKWLLARLGAILAPTGEYLPTKYALKDMAIASGFNVAPALYVMQTANVNAFIFAHRSRRAVVGVTEGLVTRMDIDEQRAVFANLMARLASGDIATATSVSSLMRPMWAWRDRDFRRGQEDALVTVSKDGTKTVSSRDAAELAAVGAAGGGASGVVPFLVLAFVFVLVSEIILYRRRFTDLARAEKADAEGMLLLKEPQPMLSALEKSVRFNNWVPNAGPSFGSLFYCWTGEDTDDEEDPEWRRVTRLREVLGVEGLAPPVIEPNRRVIQPPVAPRVAHAPPRREPPA
jgi:Zn-dependent protease with chaperone function